MRKPLRLVHEVVNRPTAVAVGDVIVELLPSASSVHAELVYEEEA